MSVFLWILVIFISIYIGLSLYGRKYKNRYKCTMIFGKPGSGKSTLLCKLALKYSKMGWTVYSTEHTPNTYYIAPEEIGFVQLKENSVLLIDEAGTIFDNRNFKNFRPEVRDFFKLHRHYKVKIYLFSQTFDIDKKIRDITDDMYLITCVFNVFSYGKRILRHITLTKSEADRPSTIAEDLMFESILWFWAGSRFFTFIPKYVKYFNSFEAPRLKDKVFDFVEPVKTVKIPVRKKRRKK